MAIKKELNNKNKHNQETIQKETIKKISEEGLSLIIPCYNEEIKFKENIDKIISFLNKFKKKELILINDGSSDRTLDEFQKAKKKFKFIKIISYKRNKGKGYAVKKGLLNATYKYILISDIDLSTPLEDFYKLSSYIERYDIVIGSRGLKNSNVIIKQPFFKELLGRIGNFFINLILNLNIKDTQCGFKLMKDNSKEIFKRIKSNGFGYDFEFLFVAKKHGFKIKEVPITWKNDKRSKVKFKHYLITLYELLKVKYNDLKGFYYHTKF